MDVLRSDVFFFSSRRRHTRLQGDWSSDVCSSDLRLFGVRRRSAAIIVASVLLTYALLTGGRPSAMRAAVIACAFCGGILLRTRSRSEERRVGEEGRSRWSPYH